MEITINVPALLFPAISLLLLAYTNRFMALAALVRKLSADYRDGKSHPEHKAQIRSLRKRINKIKFMQSLGILSFLLCVASIFCIFYDWTIMARNIFAVSLLSLLASLIFSLIEILQSTTALEVELKEFD